MRFLFSFLATLLCAVLMVAPAAAQFNDMFRNMFKQQQQQKPTTPKVYDSYHQSECRSYLCPDSLTCVAQPLDCPCLFPDSQIKCILPDRKNYVCISKPAPGDRSPRDCSFVNKAYKGLV